MLRSVALALVALALVTPLAAQDARPIREGQTLSGTLASDSEHDFTLRVDAEYFVFGEVDQIDVDVIVKVHGSLGALTDHSSDDTGRLYLPSPEPWAVKRAADDIIVLADGTESSTEFKNAPIDF